MPKKYNKKQLDTDAKNFFHLIKLRAHFKDINPKSNRKYIYWFSTKWPKQRKKRKKMKNPKQNLSKGEQKSMEEFAKRKEIIITNADEGGAVVVMGVEKYINEANHQLSN